MTCGNYGYPVNYYPNTMMRQNPGMQQQGMQQQPGMPPMQVVSGPTYSVPVVPLGTGQQMIGGVMQESFIENILRFNKGKVGTFYFTYQGNNKWNAMAYRGRVETAGRDHLIISDPASGKRYLLLMANLDWAEFDDQINYPFNEINPEIKATLTTTD